MMVLLRTLLLLGLALPALPAAAEAIWIMADPEDAYHRSLTQTLLAKSWPADTELTVHPAIEAIPPAIGRPDLVITLGETAAARNVAWPGPVLHAFVTEAQFNALYFRGAPKDHTALFLEQPADRHVALVRAALPHVKSLLVPTGPGGGAGAPRLHEAAARAGLTVREAVAGSAQELDELLERADPSQDAVLFLPDPALRSNTMIKVALLGAYQRRLPLIAYSEGLVMAGALAAVHSTVPLLAEEIADGIDDFVTGRRLAPPSPPSRYDVSVNYQLAKSLNLRIPAKAVLMQKIQEVSHGRP